jgi:hypothetical protein
VLTSFGGDAVRAEARAVKDGKGTLNDCVGP